MAKNGDVIDFASGRAMSASQVDEAIEKYGEADDGIGPDFRELLDIVAPQTARLVGTHRGVLAGLDRTERDRAIDAYVLSDVFDSGLDDVDGSIDVADDAAIDSHAVPADEGAERSDETVEEEVGASSADSDAEQVEAVETAADPSDGDLEPEEAGFEGAVEPGAAPAWLSGVDPCALLLEGCEPGPVRTKLSELLMGATMDWLKDCAADFGMGDFATPSKRKMASRLATAMAQDATALQRGLSGLSEVQFKSVRRVHEAGGVLVVPDDEVTVEDLPNIPVPTPPMLFCFHKQAFDDERAAFTFVIADELQALMDRIDWEAATKPIDQRATLGRYLEACVNMRGIVPQDELMEGYLDEVGDPLSEDEFMAALPYALQESEGGTWVLLPSDDEPYFLASQLGAQYLDRHPECDDPDDQSSIIDGDLDDMLEELLDAQEPYDPAPVPAELIAAPNYFEWTSGLPGALALTAFLDEHVPDGENDYYFADTFVESVQTLAHTGFTDEEYRMFIERLYHVDDAEVLARAWELALAVANETPRWDCNGWTEDQLLEDEQD